MSLRLPKEIERYVASLVQIYKIKGKNFLQRLLANAIITIEQQSYDGWDGGQYGFLLHLQVPDIIFAQLVETKDKYESEISGKLNKLIKIPGEFIDCVSIEMRLFEDDNWREKSGLVLPAKKQISNNVLERIWKPSSVRAFLGHKAKYKDKAGELKDELEKYGVSCFVAHKDIEPTTEWIHEIENALFSMDLLIALMTEDFHDSNWTDQEIGVAVGRHIPIISIKIGKDPYGFIGKYQALSGTLEDIPKIAKDVLDIIVKNSAIKEKTKRAVVNAFKNSSSYDNTKLLVSNVLPHLKKLEESYIDEIITAFNENNQIYDSWSAEYHLPSLLHKWTGNRYSIKDKKLIRIQPQTECFESDDILF